MSTTFHPYTVSRTEQINATMDQYLRVNHQQNDWVKLLPMGEFAANNGTSETTKWTPCCALQGVDPQMSYSAERMKEQDHRQLDADQVQGMKLQIHQHSWVEMRWSQPIEADGANWERILAPHIQEGSQAWLDAHHIRITRPTWELECKWFGPFVVVRRVLPYPYVLELPASIRIHQVQPVSLPDPVVNDPLVG